MDGRSFKDMKHSDIDAVISRAEKAVESGASISPADLMLLLEGFKAFFHVQERLQNNDLTLRRLRKLLGIIPSSEKSNHGKQTTRTAETDTILQPGQTHRAIDRCIERSRSAVIGSVE